MTWGRFVACDLTCPTQQCLPSNFSQGTTCHFTSVTFLTDSQLQPFRVIFKFQSRALPGKPFCASWAGPIVLPSSIWGLGGAFGLVTPPARRSRSPPISEAHEPVSQTPVAYAKLPAISSWPSTRLKRG